MDLNDKSVKIPYPILKRLVDVLDHQEDQELVDLHFYLYGKKVQLEMREEYNPNNKEAVTLYNRNKAVVEEVEQKIKDSVLNTNL